MIAYLGRKLAAGRAPIAVQYLGRIEQEPQWLEGSLVAIDPQGACFIRSEEDRTVTDCLPWGSIVAIRVTSD